MKRYYELMAQHLALADKPESDAERAAADALFDLAQEELARRMARRPETLEEVAENLWYVVDDFGSEFAALEPDGQHVQALLGALAGLWAMMGEGGRMSAIEFAE